MVALINLIIYTPYGNYYGSYLGSKTSMGSKRCGGIFMRHAMGRGCKMQRVKTMVATAILLGGEIKSVRDFFDYCLALLTTQLDFQVGVLRAKCIPFTASRRFYLLDFLELAIFLAEAENVTTWSGLRDSFASVTVFGRVWTKTRWVESGWDVYAHGALTRTS